MSAADKIIFFLEKYLSYHVDQFKGLKSIVSAPVSVVKGVGKAGWSGVKTVGKTLKSPKVVGAGTTVAGALTANPALITAGVGIVSSDYINQHIFA